MTGATSSGRLEVAGDGTVLHVDDAVLAMTGRSRPEVVGEDWLTLLTRPARLFWLARLGGHTTDRVAETAVQLDLLDRDGRAVPVAARVTRRADGSRTITVTDARVAAPEPADDWWAAVLDAACYPLVVLDADHTVLAWNRAAGVVTGYGREDAVGRSLPELLGAGEPTRVLALADALGGWPAADLPGLGPRTELLLTRADGVRVVAELALSTGRHAGRDVRVAQLRDLGRLASIEPAVTGAARAAALLPAVEGAGIEPDVVVLGIAADGRYDLLEGSGPLVTGLRALIGRHYAETLAARPESLEAVERALTGETVGLQSRLFGRDWRMVCRARTSATGEPAGAMLVATETTALAALQAEAAMRSTTDRLTGLLNRAGLHEALLREVGEDRPGRVALIELDLDAFTGLNEALGSAVGDLVLVETARRLRTAAPGGAVLARPGGDEFAVLMGAHVHEQPELAARRIARALAAPMDLAPDLDPVVVCATLGISRWPDDARDGSELLSHADAAVRRARASHSPVVTFDVRHDDPRGRYRMVSRLRAALAAGVVEAHVQPVVDLATGAMRSVEALVRWTDDELGQVSPAAMVAAAEDARLIDDLGAVVLDRALEMLAGWDRQGPEVERVAVNVSPLQLRSGRLAPTLQAALARHAISGERITLELTESAVADLDDVGLRALDRVRRTGVRIALDDFGTGHSSLARLRDLPVDVVKLDRSFVTGLPESVPAALISAFIGVADALGLVTVAEGVETAAQCDALRRAGCQEAQGYLFSRPVPGDLLAEHASALTAVPRSAPARHRRALPG